ncbi:hypothetical protein GCM10028857_19100 [Salinarchaeum chitinilyticum]
MHSNGTGEKTEDRKQKRATMTDEPREDVIYRVKCNTCGKSWDRDPKDGPSHWPERDWDAGAARSAAKGKRDSHRMNTQQQPDMKRHDVEIVEVEHNDA